MTIISKNKLGRLALVMAGALLISSVSSPVFAWWRYAEWGRSPEQIVAASRGDAVPCQANVPVCMSTTSGTPALHIPRVEMIGLPGSAGFVFDGGGGLVLPVPTVGVDEVSGMVSGVHGPARDNAPGTRTWHDQRRGTIITATAAASGTQLIYRPSAR